ncbi:MAG TPA: ATP-dependent sacrificial sulfur transferase LarE [Cyanobacteria bacterium UBA8530]|nr:ATP-dependent sacrificial sulfur transferase LarE [Cyanobacteria bacterium UBA8530]
MSQEKYRELQELLRKMGKVAVAFSGGVDSTFLLKVAVDTLGKNGAIALIGDSESFPRREKEAAEEIAKSFGVEFLVVKSEELSDPRYTENPPDRCYFCKHSLFSRLLKLARKEECSFLLDGNNADDRGDWRPGQRAAREIGVRSPLMEVELTKNEIRQLSRELTLPTAEKPSFACLASRLPYGTPVTSEALARVEASENFLHDLGFGQLRVRHHGDLARIEVEPEDYPKFLEPSLRDRIGEALKKFGYQFVALDLDGYRTGSMNRGLAERKKIEH